MKTVIVGGVAGGATAAARLRRLDENAQIVVFEKSGYVSYANCGLPYFIGGVITDREDLTLQTPQSFYSRFRIDVKTSHEVLDIDKNKKTVTVKDLKSGKTFEESYDTLILSPGAKPLKPDLPGIDSPKIFTLRNVEDTFAIYDFVQKHKPEKAVVIGGGYIGLETAENLYEKGLEVSVLQRPKQLMNTLDYDMATFVHAKLREKGIKLMLGCNVTGFEEKDSHIIVTTADSGNISADMVILAIGVVPDTALADKAGLEKGVKGCIKVNSHMQSSVKDIYAVGDAVEVTHFVSKEKASIALAGPANKQGRIAADNICGIHSEFKGSMGSSIIKVFDLTVAGTGLTEKAALKAGLECESIILAPSSHASYYPGAKTMTLKVVFEKKTGRLLGAQAIGKEGVDKRIDVLATAIMAGLGAEDLKDLDLCYAPPFSSAKDPVNMAGFVMDNILSGRIKQFHFEDVDKLPRDGSVTLLDTRTTGEYSRGHVEGFMNIPVDELRERLGELDKSKKIYVMCQSGLRSYISTCILNNSGFDAFNFAGGYRFYSAVKNEMVCAESSLPCGMDK
ncbi:MAG: CoA-disulfide reductase [Sphaerochaetaceae bacterium]|nr:CoA-disulfide reductase [Sphaerochaetaceae bacterium]